MNLHRAIPVALLAGVLTLVGCGPAATGPDVPIVSGSAAALAGTWDFTIPRAATTCSGVMTIDGTTGQGTFTTCPSLTGPMAGGVDANGQVLLVFRPNGFEPFWVRGTLTTATQIDGKLYGHDWNGQQDFVAIRR